MVPTVIAGKNRIAASRTLKKLLRGLNKKGYRIKKIDAERLDSPAEILAEIESPPLLGEKTAVIVSYLSENKPGKAKEILQAVKNALPNTKSFSGRLIFYEPYEDSRVVKQAKKWMWRILDHKETSKRGLASHIAKKLKKKGVDADYSLGRKIAERTGFDSNRAETEAEKLGFYFRTTGEAAEAGKEAAVDQLVPESKESKVWTLLDNVFDGKRKESSAELQRLFETGEDPIQTLHLLYRQFRKLAMFVSLTETRGGAGENVEAKEIGVPPFALKRFKSAAQRLSAEKIAGILETAVLAEYKIKTGRVDPETGVAMIVHKAL